MSNIKADLLKEIEAKIAKNKQLAQKASRQKTVANWVAEFFTEYEKLKKLDQGTMYEPFASLALNRLNIQLRNLDRKCVIDLKQAIDGTGPIVEIRWSKRFIQTNNCEEVLVFDPSSAYFQSALEDI